MLVATASMSDTMCVDKITIRSPDSSDSKLRKRTRSSRIEPGRGLVHDQQLRIVQQRLRNPDALAHSAGIPAQWPLGRAAQIDQFQQFTNPRPRRSCRDPFYRREILQKFKRIQIGIYAEILRQITKHRAKGIRIPRDVRIVPQNAPGRGLRNRRQNTHQRGLARAVRPQQPQHTRTERELYTVQRAHRARFAAIFLAEIFHDQSHEFPFR